MIDSLPSLHLTLPYLLVYPQLTAVLPLNSDRMRGLNIKNKYIDIRNDCLFSVAEGDAYTTNQLMKSKNCIVILPTHENKKSGII